MLRDGRAILFDLDDTLYPQRRFILSGFAAVSRHVALRHSVEPRAAFACLVRAYRGAERGHELDRLIDAFELTESVDALVAIMRTHRPSLRLDWATQDALRTLRRQWALGIVTNGLPDVQRAKVQALGLDAMVDTVVYAAEHGSGAGKPDRAPFRDALRRLGARPSQSVFVGDNPETDIAGASLCGLRTIYTRQWRSQTWPFTHLQPNSIVQHISEVPAVVNLLLTRKLVHHAA